jgi:hypothetical protein
MNAILSRRSPEFLFLVGVLVALAALSRPAAAQLPTATILGVVKDSSGAVVPDTALTARNVETGQTRTTVSAADGSYRFSALPVGAYEVRAEHPGFQTAVRSGLTLSVTQEAVVNFSLQVGAVTETVSVTAEAPLVNTTSGSLGGLVGEQTVADLPLNGRNYIDLTLLQPGVTQAVTPPTSLNRGLWFSSNGAPVRSNNFMLDGALLRNQQGLTSAGVTGDTLGVDGIREYRVITNNFSAEYGMKIGSQVVMVSKGGTNSFHGDVFEYLRNSALDARNFFDLKSAATGPGFRLPPYKRNQFGASAGGPIKKDKTFVYGVYEALRERLGITILDTVPSAGCHGAAGATITNTACPQLGAVASAKISPVTAPLLSQYPIPNVANNGFTYPFSQPTRDDYGQIRVDHTFSSNDNLFGRYTIDDTERLSPVTGQTYPQATTSWLSRNQYATLSESHIFSSALLNTARFSFSRTGPRLASYTTVAGPQYGFVADPLNNPDQEMGVLSIGGITTMGPTTQGPNWLLQNIFTWSDDLFYTRGKHTLKFGTLINRFQQYDWSKDTYRGSATFGNVGSFLLGNPTQYQARVAGPLGTNYAHTYLLSTVGFYAQDDWRVTSRLTLNLGLRYEFETQFHEKYGVQASLHDIQHDAAPTVGLDYLNPSLHDFSPRVGFAWDVTGDGKTSVRGGFGEFFDLAFGGTTIDPMGRQLEPFSYAPTILNPPAGSFTIPFTIPANFIPSSVPFYFDYHMRQPHLLSYNLTVERQLPGHMALTLAYAGSRGINILAARDGNPTVPQGVPLSGGCVPRPTGQAVNLSQPTCWLGNDPYTNPNFPTIQLVQANADSHYNSLQILLAKQMSKGLQFQSSYVWSKSMDDQQGEGGGTPLGEVAYSTYPQWLYLARAVSSFDTTQNWRFNAIYRLPDLANGNSLLKGVLNGWQASGIVSLQTGYPFTPTLQANRSLSKLGSGASGIDEPNLVAGRSSPNIVSGTSAGCLGVNAGTPVGTPTLYFDPCAFSIQTAGFLGTAGRNILRGPGLANLDISLVKDTAIKRLGEAGKVEFRAEFFNILNHANFQIPAFTVFAGTANPQAPLSNAGVITATNTTSRQIQLALKVMF